MNKQILLMLSGVAIFATSSAFAMDIYGSPSASTAPPCKPISIYADASLTLAQLADLPSKNYATSSPTSTYKVTDVAAFDRDLKALRDTVAENVDGVLYDFMTCKKTTVGGTDQHDEVTYTYTLKNPKIPGCPYFSAKTRDNKDTVLMAFASKIAVTFKKQ